MVLHFGVKAAQLYAARHGELTAQLEVATLQAAERKRARLNLASSVAGASTCAHHPCHLATLLAQVGGKPTVAWTNANDLRFCTTRQCGTKVELGARCDDKVVLCCDREDEGGHPQATCKSPTAGAPTVCTVSGGPQSSQALQCMQRSSCTLSAGPC